MRNLDIADTREKLQVYGAAGLLSRRHHAAPDLDPAHRRRQSASQLERRQIDKIARQFARDALLRGLRKMAAYGREETRRGDQHDAEAVAVAGRTADAPRELAGELFDGVLLVAGARLQRRALRAPAPLPLPVRRITLPGASAPRSRSCLAL
jgi:hypothetical protein